MLFYLIFLLRFYPCLSTEDAEVTVTLDVPTQLPVCLYPDSFPAHITHRGRQVEMQMRQTRSHHKDYIVIDPYEEQTQSSILYTDRKRILEVQLTCTETGLSVRGTLTVTGDTVLLLDDTSRLNYRPGYIYSLHAHTTFPTVFDDIHVDADEDHRRREKRDTADVFIDVLVLVGHSVYQRWETYTVANMTGSVRSVEQQIKKHFHMLINSVDLRFKSISSKYNIEVVEVIIQDTSGSEWLNGVTGNVYGKQLIRLIENWTTSTSGLPRHDVAVVYERTSLYSEEDFISIYEFSQQNTLCNSSSSTVAVSYQDEIGIDMSSTARGIARALGAEEDGPDTNCSDTDDYLMSSNYTHLFSERSQIFSSCSQTQIQNYIETLLRTSNVSRSCLTQPENITEVTGSLPGQVYSPDVQCYLMYGLDSFYCHHPDDANHSDICHLMYCYFPGSTTCYSKVAADGTTCGNKMEQHTLDHFMWKPNSKGNDWTEMVYRWTMCGSKRRPATNPECVHGDQRQIGILSSARSCETAITSGLYQCYASHVEVSCCTTCTQSRLANPDCYYGDKVSNVPNCNYSECSVNISNTAYLSACCDTCSNLSTPATLPTSTLSAHVSTVSANEQTLSTTSSPSSDESTASFSAEDPDSDGLAVGLGVGLPLALLLVLGGLLLLYLYKKKLYRVQHAEKKDPNQDQPSDLTEEICGNKHLILLHSCGPSSTKLPV